jgi:hypothetical protein
MAELMPRELRDAAQRRYAELLERVAERVRVQSAELVARALADPPVDWIGLEDALAQLARVGHVAGGEIAAAHMAELTGVSVPVRVDPPDQVPVWRIREVYAEAVTDGVDPSDAVRRAITAAEDVAADVVHAGAADGTGSWSAGARGDGLATTEIDARRGTTGRDLFLRGRADVTQGPIGPRAGVAFWLRVTKPGETCGLCITAASKLYFRPDLRPIHKFCRCTVRPVLADERVSELLAGPTELWQDIEDRMDDIEAELGPVPRKRGDRGRRSHVRIVTP